jgi:Tfp pilus assembly protein PilF
LSREKARLAEDRALAWKMIGDLPSATEYAEPSVQFTPRERAWWLMLADFYTLQGKSEDAAEAPRRAAALTTPR